MTVFSTTSEVYQDQPPCRQGNLFIADMTVETLEHIQFSGSVKGIQIPVLLVTSQYCLPNTTPGTINELRFSVQGQSHTVINDLGKFQIARPEDLIMPLAVGRGLMNICGTDEASRSYSAMSILRLISPQVTCCEYP